MDKSSQENIDLSKYKKLVMIAGFASVTTAILFLILKVVVWMLSESTAIFASLTDSLFDVLASLVNLLALRYSLTPPDKDHRYGHYKSQALASLAQAAFIGGSSVLLIVHGVERCINPSKLMYMELAIGVSVITTIFTIVLITIQTFVYKKTKSDAIAADRLHYSSDVFLNLSVILSLVLSYYGHDWADGLFAALIGIFILLGVYKIGIGAIQTLLDKSLSPKLIAQLLEQIIKVKGVKSVHDLKTHSAGPIVFIQGHIVMDSNISLKRAHEIVNHVEDSVREKFPDAEITLHMEPDIKATYEDVQFDDRTHVDENGVTKVISSCIHDN